MADKAGRNLGEAEESSKGTVNKRAVETTEIPRLPKSTSRGRGWPESRHNHPPEPSRNLDARGNAGRFWNARSRLVEARAPGGKEKRPNHPRPGASAAFRVARQLSSTTRNRRWDGDGARPKTQEQRRQKNGRARCVAPRLGLGAAETPDAAETPRPQHKTSLSTLPPLAGGCLRTRSPGRGLERPQHRHRHPAVLRASFSLDAGRVARQPADWPRPKRASSTSASSPSIALPAAESDLCSGSHSTRHPCPELLEDVRAGSGAVVVRLRAGPTARWGR